MQFSPRVGFAWDPTGDGRMSIRTGYSLANDFVNAQFHLNTSVAPPWGAEVRVHAPGRRASTTRSRRQRPDEHLPVHARRRTSPLRARRARTSPSPRTSSRRAQQSWNVSVQRQLGDDMAVSATYIGTFLDRGWNVRSLNEGVFMGTGPCTLNTHDRSADVPGLHDHRDAQQSPPS